ncbi:hypothetical protein K458DRAFT_153004 [Lentithecium fluviatile CBS 122367]|uniref:Secreted protein n=1 Tax=Lentithecium fluviatile CBS 122367 TaxID=1168545 RepID=A0A6G1JF09_9PLEO|nr:hypothetical protein K458DRAFT_153004 [Lentithecium fluviatile CBS 122367]
MAVVVVGVGVGLRTLAAVGVGWRGGGVVCCRNVRGPVGGPEGSVLGGDQYGYAPLPGKSSCMKLSKLATRFSAYVYSTLYKTKTGVDLPLAALCSEVRASSLIQGLNAS